MDTFMDKLAQRLTAQEMIKANAAADAEELGRLRNQVKEYNECLAQMRHVNREMKAAAEHMERMTEDVIAPKVEKLLLDAAPQMKEVVGVAIAPHVERLTGEGCDILREAGGRLERAGAALNQAEGKLGNTRMSLEAAGKRLEETGLTIESTGSRLEETGTRLEESQGRLEKTGTRLEESQGRLEETGTRLEESQGRLEETGTRLEESRGRLEETGTRLEESRGRLEETGIRLEESRGRFEETRGRLEESVDRLEAARADGSRINRLIEESLAGIREIQQDQEAFEKLKKELGEMFSQSDEYVHKENVKVYRNVQAVVVEESNKHSEAIDKAASVMTTGMKTVIGVSAAALVAAVADIALQLLIFFKVLS